MTKLGTKDSYGRTKSGTKDSYGMTKQNFILWVMDRVATSTTFSKGYFDATTYDKNQKIIDKQLFNILLGIDEKTGKSRQVLALERARKIYERFDHSNPAQEESSTTVFQLVHRLNHEG